jgi:hypothetical protein
VDFPSPAGPARASDEPAGRIGETLIAIIGTAQCNFVLNASRGDTMNQPKLWQSHSRDWVQGAIRSSYRRLTAWGVDGRVTFAAIQGFTVARRDRNTFRRQRDASQNGLDFPDGSSYFVYGDRADTAGVATGHYFHQDLMVAREIFNRRPRRHIDVGSSVSGFVSHVGSFREIDVLDVRPLSVDVPGIRFYQQDVMHLEEQWHGVTDSLSCLHALEHFGLGRYGDEVDYDGWRRGLTNLIEMLEPGGVLYLSVPTSHRQRVEFNAHRVFSLPRLRDILAENLQIEGLAFITDAGNLVSNVDPFGPEAEASFGANYGCSVWVLRKP